MRLFEECYTDETIMIDGVEHDVIDLSHLTMEQRKREIDDYFQRPENWWI